MCSDLFDPRSNYIPLLTDRVMLKQKKVNKNVSLYSHKKIDIVQNELINKLDPDITTQENKY